MRKLTTALMASAVAVSMATPARAGDTERLLFGIGAAIVGEGIKAINNRQQAQPRQQPQQQRQAPARSQAASPSRPAVSRPARVPDENARFVQQKLHDLGYTEVGGADGFWGSNSARALGLFMADNGLTGEPKPSPEITAALAKAQTRQQIADARKASAVAEATMPAATVVDGIVHFQPTPEQKAAEAERIAAEEAVQPEDFSEDDLKPVGAVSAPAAPVVEQKVPAPVAETAAAPEEEPKSVVVAEPVKTETVTKEAAVAKQEPAEEKADTGGVQKVNGLTVSGDF